MKPILKHILGVAVFMAVAATAAWLLTQSSFNLFRKKLPTYGIVTSFALTESSGQTITNRDLSGKIWVADFIYTRCPGPCLSLTQQMLKLQQQLPADVKLVSISVDPQADTPEVLKAYATKHEIDPTRWLMLTGPKAKVYELIENGFHVSATPNPDINESPEDRFIHSTKMVLVDKNGAIRGYYDGIAQGGIEELMRDLRHLQRD